MIKSTVEKMANPIGFEIGASDDVTQSELLNGFARGFNDSIGNDHNLSLQACYIADKLDDKAKKVLRLLVDFINNKD